MAKTELEIQNEIRARNGMLPLTELAPKPETPEQKTVRLQQEQQAEAIKKAEEDRARIEAEDKEKADAQRIADEKAAKEKEEKLQIENEKKVIPEVADLDDEALLKQLQKRNPKIKSFEDLNPKPSADEVEQEKENREADKLSWGLKTGRFKKKDLEGFIQDSKDAKALVFSAYSAKVKAADPDKTEDEIKAMFDERYGIDQAPESWQHKQGQEELAILAEKHLQKNYGAILSLENEYAAHEKNENAQSSLQAKILANVPAYKRDVEEVFNSASVYKTKIGKDEIVIPLPQEFIQRAKDLVLSENFAAVQVAKGWNKEELAQLAQTMIFIENRSFIDQKVGEQYLLNHQKGARGIVPDLNQRRQPDQVTLDENQQKAAERHGAVVPAAIKN